MNSDWTKKTYDFNWLARKAAEYAPVMWTVDWLKAIGVIPTDVDAMKVSQVRLELDPDAIEAGYLASVAFEWDSWGPSSPTDLMFALECELKGSPQRDAISDTLLALGRAATEDVNAGLALSAA